MPSHKDRTRLKAALDKDKSAVNLEREREGGAGPPLQITIIGY